MRMMAALAVGVLPTLMTAEAQAREPGAGALFPPGLTLGIPIAFPVPTGFYIDSRMTYYSAALIDDTGRASGQYADIAGDAFLAIWAPGWKLLGGSYKMFLLAPFTDITQNRTTPLPASAHGKANQFGLATLKLQPFDISWELADGLYAAAGFGVYFPVGPWSPVAAVNAGSNFWTFEPTLAVTYFKDGWNISLHAAYDINTTNPVSNYTSGNELFVNATLTKNIEGFDTGPVGYYTRQVTADWNGGAYYTGATSLPPEQYAIGGAVGRRFERFYLQLMFTQDVYARNTYMGSKAWFNVTVKAF